MIVYPVTVKDREPGGGFNVFAPVFVPFYVGFVAEDSGPFFADVGDGEEGADVEADAVVEVGVPADGLFFKWFPAHEDVVTIFLIRIAFAFEDQFQFFLQVFCGGEFFLGTVDTVVNVLLLAADPVAEVGVNQRFQQLGIEFVVVDQDCEAIGQTVPNMPDEGTLLEHFAVLGKKFIT